jgi:hypothetical protein
MRAELAFWRLLIGTAKVRALQTAYEHVLTCTAFDVLVDFGTYLAQKLLPNLVTRAKATGPRTVRFQCSRCCVLELA